MDWNPLLKPFYFHVHRPPFTHSSSKLTLPWPLLPPPYSRAVSCPYPPRAPCWQRAGTSADWSFAVVFPCRPVGRPCWTPPLGSHLARSQSSRRRRQRLGWLPRLPRQAKRGTRKRKGAHATGMWYLLLGNRTWCDKISYPDVLYGHREKQCD